VTHEKVTSSEGNPAFRVPFLTIQEVESILEDGFFHPSIKDNGLKGAFWTRGGEAPFVPHVRSVD